MKITIPSHILTILTMLNEEGHEAFLVGGCVRDILMSRDPHDYDITTSALPMEVATLFQRASYQVLPTGIKHGTLSVLSNTEWIEITTYRIEGTYHHHRMPEDVYFTKDVIEDLKRRDFTMNAIAYHPSIGFIDPFHGKEDIQKQTIRCVGIAEERFQEDALRILRAVRFACTLNFHIETMTWNAVREKASLLKHISYERIQSEFNKLLLGEKNNTLTYLKDANILFIILPELQKLEHFDQKTPWHINDLFMHTDQALNYSKGYPLESKLALIFHDIGKPATQYFDTEEIAHYPKHANISILEAKPILRRFKYSKKRIDKILTLIAYHDFYVQDKKNILRKFLSKFDNDLALALQVLDVQLADDHAKNLIKAQDKIDIILTCKERLSNMVAKQDTIRLKDLALNGNDLILLGYQGKDIKEALSYLYDYVLEDPTRNEKEQLLNALHSKNEKKPSSEMYL